MNLTLSHRERNYCCYSDLAIINDFVCFRGLDHTSGRPMLLALVKPDNMTSNSTFYKVCTEVSQNLNFLIIKMFSSTSLMNCLKLLVYPKQGYNTYICYLSLICKAFLVSPKIHLVAGRRSFHYPPSDFYSVT